MLCRFSKYTLARLLVRLDVSNLQPAGLTSETTPSYNLQLEGNGPKDLQRVGSEIPDLRSQFDSIAHIPYSCYATSATFRAISHLPTQRQTVTVTHPSFAARAGNLFNSSQIVDSSPV